MISPKFTNFVFILITLLTTVRANSAELSFLHGGFQREKIENIYTKTSIGLGARYAMQFSDRMYWYGEGSAEMTSFSGPLAPDDHTALKAGGGVRYYFDRLSERFVPYAAGLAYLGSEEMTTYSENSVQSIRSMGLFYGAAFGLRWSLTEKFFLDLESKLFTSALFEKQEVKVNSRVGNVVTKSSLNNNKTNLYASSFGDLSNIVLAIGARL